MSGRRDPGRAAADAWRRTLRQLGRAAVEWDLGDDTVVLAEELVAQAWDLSPPRRMALALLVLAVASAERQGSTCLPLTGEPLLRRLGALCRAAGLDTEPAQVARDIRALCKPTSTRGMSQLIGQPGDALPLIAAGGAVASHRLHQAESRLAVHLAARLAADGSGEGADRAEALAAAGEPTLAAALADLAARPSRRAGVDVTLSGEQVQAVALAASRRLAVISGGPGTGKTAIAAALCRILVRTGTAAPAIALCAPTGKAAQRLGSAVAAQLGQVAEPAEADRSLAAELPAARTLHRLLGYSARARRFRHHARAPLPAQVVIVDEASMVDLTLMERLCRALEPGARLVLLGDADQLPSVDAGAVLSDLARVGQSQGWAARLSTSYRMDQSDPGGRDILVAAAAVRSGRARALGERPPVAAASALRHSGVERLRQGGDAAGLRQLVDAWFTSRIAAGGAWAEHARQTIEMQGGALTARSQGTLDALAAALDASRVLCATRRLAGGTDHLNDLFHRRAAAELGAPVRQAAPGELLPGEPVVMRENDYSRGLYNGDVGVVVRQIVTPGPGAVPETGARRLDEGGGRPQLVAAFGDGGGTWRTFPLAALRPRLDRAFAMTVHQSQGSEYDHVALVLPQVDLPLSTRELVYTAMTRARRSVTVCGDDAVLEAAVARTSARHSGLATLLSSR